MKLFFFFNNLSSTARPVWVTGAYFPKCNFQKSIIFLFLKKTEKSRLLRNCSDFYFYVAPFLWYIFSIFNFNQYTILIPTDYRFFLPCQTMIACNHLINYESIRLSFLTLIQRSSSCLLCLSAPAFLNHLFLCRTWLSAMIAFRTNLYRNRAEELKDEKWWGNAVSNLGPLPLFLFDLTDALDHTTILAPKNCSDFVWKTNLFQKGSTILFQDIFISSLWNCVALRSDIKNNFFFNFEKIKINVKSLSLEIEFKILKFETLIFDGYFS